MSSLVQSLVVNDKLRQVNHRGLYFQELFDTFVVVPLNIGFVKFVKGKEVHVYFHFHAVCGLLKLLFFLKMDMLV